MQVKKRAKAVKFGKMPERRHEENEADQKPVVHQDAVEDIHAQEDDHMKTRQEAEQAESPENIQSPAEEAHQEVIQKEEHIKEDLTFIQKEPDVTYTQVREENIKSQEIHDSGHIQTHEPVREQTEKTEIPDQPDYQASANAQQQEEAKQIIQDEPNHLEEEQANESAPQTEQATEPYPSLGGDTYIVEKEVRSGMLGYFFLIAIVAFLIGIASMAAANYYLMNSKSVFSLPFMTATATPTPTAEPTKAPTPTIAAVSKSEVSISILNGSGITGAAAKLESSLNEEGYKVISKGNADNSEYTDTVIQAKDTVSEAYLDELTGLLDKTYSVSADIKTASDSASDTDVTIIIGSDTSSN